LNCPATDQGLLGKAARLDRRHHFVNVLAQAFSLSPVLLIMRSVKFSENFRKKLHSCRFVRSGLWRE
jgi:hypothetical protein